MPQQALIRYERASLIVTPNRPFAGAAAAAMIDCLVHHAEVIALTGDSYRLKDRDLGRLPATTIDGQKRQTTGGEVDF